MIINNSAYLNYLTTLGKPSNDVNTADTAATKDTDNTDTANQTTANTPVTLPANMDSLDITSSSTWKYNTTETGLLPDFKLGDWENTSGILFGGNTMTVEERSFAVYLPQALQDKMNADPEFAKEIQGKLEEFFNSNTKESGTLEDGTQFNVIAQQMAVAMDENGNIMHTYVRTESYSVSNSLGDVANDETPASDQNTSSNNSLTIKYGFAMYQTTLQIGSAANKELTDEEKNSNAMAAIGVEAVITVETAQVSGSEPATEIRKANGDIVELETGKLIQKHAGYSDGSQKFDNKA